MPTLHKLYVDCVDDHGRVVVAYVTKLQACGLSMAPAGIELYEPDGRRTIHRGRAQPFDRTAGSAGAPFALRFDVRGRRCTLEIEPVQGAMPCPAHMPDGLRWVAHAARARVVVRDLPGAGDRIAGTGYAESVTITRAPQALGLSRLEWGRAHLEGGSVIYTALESDRRPAFHSAVVWPHGGRPLALAAFTLEPGARAGERRLRFAGDPQPYQLELAPLRELHHGASVDGARFPSQVERLVSRLFAGRTAERRFVSRAESPELGRGFAVHEAVRFGASASEPFG